VGIALGNKGKTAFARFCKIIKTKNAQPMAVLAKGCASLF